MLHTRLVPLVISLGLHALVAILLLWGFPDLTSPSSPPPRPIVQARIVALQQTTPEPEPASRSAPAPKPKPKPAPEPDAAAKQREAERAQAQRRLEQQRIEERREEAERKKKEQEQAEQRRLEEQRLLERQRELERRRDLLAEAAADEEARILAARDQALAASFTSVIERAIIANWSRPASARNNMEAELMIQLVPTGEVVNVTVVRSSGNAAFDRSAENAVLRARRFPELQELPNRVFEQNFRRFRLIFRPEDLRR